MRNLLGIAIGIVFLTGALGGCSGTTSNEEWCKDFYGLKPGSWEYNYCIENDGDTYKSMIPKLE